MQNYPTNERAIIAGVRMICVP